MGHSAADVDLLVSASREEVRRRMEAGLLGMGSLWFPTLAQLRAWDRETGPLFVRWRGPYAFEIGPRLANVQAARFAPVLRGELRDEGGRTRLRAARVQPTFTLGLQALWGVVLVVWLAIGLRGVLVDGEPAGWLVFWAILVAALGATVILGRVHGGRALDAGLPELARLVQDPSEGDDDWG